MTTSSSLPRIRNPKPASAKPLPEEAEPVENGDAKSMSKKIWKAVKPVVGFLAAVGSVVRAVVDLTNDN